MVSKLFQSSPTKPNGDLKNRPSIKSVSGVTLVELMVAVGLFGVLSLGMSEVFIAFMTQNRRVENEIELNEMIHEFQDRLDLELGNATQIIMCSCGGTKCTFTDYIGTRNCGGSTAPCGNPILTWETEATTTPATNQSSISSCNSGAGLRGCKQFRALNITPATDTTPGTLTITDAVSGTVLSTLSGVTELYCGRSSSTQATGFKLRVRSKTRMYNQNDTSSSDFESWKKSGQNWTQGIHREFNMQIDFRNLSQPGVHFGKSSTNRNCLAAGATAANSEECCSGYRSGTSNQCMNSASCSKAGATPSTPEACCSHQIDGDGKCL